MTEEQIKQFAKRPPAQYQKPEFYWRGGDVLKEQEHLYDEYKEVLAKYRRAEVENRVANNQLQDAQDVLRDREGYTNALSAYLNRDTEAARIEIEKKAQLAQIESEIKEIEVQIQDYKEIQNPAVAATFEKEKAYYLIEIQRGNKAIDLADQQNMEAKRQRAACRVNSRYRNAMRTEYQLEKVTHKKNHLRQIVSKAKMTFDALRPAQALQDANSRRERTELQNGIKQHVTYLRTKERNENRAKKHEEHLTTLFNEIEELNDSMREIGMEEEDIIDTDKLREKIFYDEEEDESSDQEEMAEEPAPSEDEVPDQASEKSPSKSSSQISEKAPSAKAETEVEAETESRDVPQESDNEDFNKESDQESEKSNKSEDKQQGIMEKFSNNIAEKLGDDDEDGNEEFENADSDQKAEEDGDKGESNNDEFDNFDE